MLKIWEPEIGKLVVPTDVDTVAESVARELLEPADPPPVSRGRDGQGPGGSGPVRRDPRARARWLGSASALATFGLAPGSDVTADQLVTALEGRHMQTRERVRHMAAIARQGVPDAERPRWRRRYEVVMDGTVAVTHVDFTLPVPDWATEEWRRSGPRRRAMIEQALLSGAEKAIEHVVVGRPVALNQRDRLRGGLARGVAAVAAVHVVAHPANGPAEAEVRGLLLGVERADGMLIAPSAALTVSMRVRREAAQVALRALAADPWLAYSGRRAEAAAMAFERGPGTPGNATRRPVAVGALTRDPVERWRESVGDRRAERIGERADELRAHLSALDDSRLLALRHKLAAGLEPPNRSTARQALSLEDDVTRLELSLSEAHRNVADLRASATATQKDVKGAFRGAAVVTQRRIVREDSALDQLLHSDGRLPARDRLDAWMERHTERAAQLVAVDRHLSGRLHRTIAGEVGRALLDPPDYVRTVIGSAPAPSAPERREWEALTATLVHDHHAAAASRASGSEPPRRDPREQRELDGRVQSLRAQRGLEPFEPATGLGDTGVEDVISAKVASFPPVAGRPSTTPATAVPRRQPGAGERLGTLAR